MPERINFSLFFNNAEQLPNRKACIEILFSAAPQWLGTPQDIFVLDWQNGTQKKGKWISDSDLISHSLSETEILFVYATNARQLRSTSQISVQEGNGKAIYTISIIQREILAYSVEMVENWLVSTFQAVALFSPVVAAVGSETELETSLKTNSEIVNYALSPFLNCYWVIVKDDLVPSLVNGFDAKKKFDNITLLCRTATLATLSFAQTS